MVGGGKQTRDKGKCSLSTRSGPVNSTSQVRESFHYSANRGRTPSLRVSKKTCTIAWSKKARELSTGGNACKCDHDTIWSASDPIDSLDSHSVYILWRQREWGSMTVINGHKLSELVRSFRLDKCFSDKVLDLNLKPHEQVKLWYSAVFLTSELKDRNYLN